MPSNSTPDVLKNLKRGFQPGGENPEEALEAYRERMNEALNEPTDYAALEQAVPEEFKPFLIQDEAEQAKREARAVKARQVKVNTQLVYANRKEPAIPGVMNRGTNAIAYYLETSGQQELLKEFEKIMSIEPDEERDAELRSKGVKEGEEAEALAYARGHMLARLSKKYMDVKPIDLMRLTDEEKLERMEELNFIYNISCNLDAALKTRNQGVEFSAEDRKICEHMLSLMEVTGAFDLETDIMTNPCYKYMDMKKLFTECDANQIGEAGKNLFMSEVDSISRLGFDFMSAGYRIQRQVGIAAEAELERRGFDLKNTVYTEPDGTPIDPLEGDGISYIAMGGVYFAKDGEKQQKICADMTGKVEIGDIEKKDYVIYPIEKILSSLGFKKDRVMFMKEDGTVWNPDDPEDLNYYTGRNFNTIYANQDGRQVAFRKSIIHGVTKPAYGYTKYYLEHEENRILAEANELKEQAQNAITRAYQPMQEAAQNNIQDAQNTQQTAKENDLPGIREMLRRSDPLLMKSSREYKLVKSAMREYAHMPALDVDNPESLKQSKELLSRILENANIYLDNKNRKTTHSRTERNRMASMLRVHEFVTKQLEQLNRIENETDLKRECLKNIREAERSISEQNERVRAAAIKTSSSNYFGKSVPRTVRKYYEDMWKAEEAARVPGEAPVIPEEPVIPDVPEEIKKFLEEQQKAAEKAAEEAAKAAVPDVPEEIKKFLEEQQKAAEEKLAACRKKIEEITDEEPIVETAETVNLEIDIIKAFTTEAPDNIYRELFLLSDGNLKEPLTEDLENNGKYLLSQVVLKRAMRNEQHAHKDNPKEGAIMQLSEKLSPFKYAEVIISTPTFQSLTKNLTRESLYDFVINMDSTEMKQQTLKIMNEIPVTARELLAAGKIYNEPKNEYEAMKGIIPDHENEAKNPTEVKNNTEAKNNAEVNPAENKEKEEQKNKEEIKNKPEKAPSMK